MLLIGVLRGDLYRRELVAGGQIILITWFTRRHALRLLALAFTATQERVKCAHRAIPTAIMQVKLHSWERFYDTL